MTVKGFITAGVRLGGVVLAAACLLGQAPQRGGTLHGSIFDAVTAMKMPATVTLLDLNDTPIRRTTIRGDFQLRDVPPGRYLLRAEAFGYIPWEYGQSDADSPPEEIAVGPGSDQELSISLMRGAVIGGRIVDPENQPVRNTEVQLLVARYDHRGRRYLAPASRIPSSRTTDGNYQFAQVPPGDYYVRAVLGNATIRSYYPGVENVTGAVAIHVPKRPTGLRGMDFFFRSVSPFKISGKVTLPESASPLTGAATIYLIPQEARFATVLDSPLPLVDFDNAPETFELRNVPPGAYDVFVRWPGYSTRIPVDVRDRDVTDLVGELFPSVDLGIEFRLDARAQELHPDLSKSNPVFLPEEWQPAANLLQVAPGRYRFSMNVPDGLFLERVWLGTQDVLGQLFEIEPRTVGPIIVELSGEGARFEGTLTDIDDKPVALATVILVPPVEFRADPTASKTARTDSSGHFSVIGIRPGVYSAYGFESIEPNAWLNEDYVSVYRALGVSVNLPRGGLLRRDLKVVPSAK